MTSAAGADAEEKEASEGEPVSVLPDREESEMKDQPRLEDCKTSRRSERRLKMKKSRLERTLKKKRMEEGSRDVEDRRERREEDYRGKSWGDASERLGCMYSRKTV